MRDSAHMHKHTRKHAQRKPLAPRHAYNHTGTRRPTSAHACTSIRTRTQRQRTKHAHALTYGNNPAQEHTSTYNDKQQVHQARARTRERTHTYTHRYLDRQTHTQTHKHMQTRKYLDACLNGAPRESSWKLNFHLPNM